MAKIKTTPEEKAGNALAFIGLLGLPAAIILIAYINSKRKE